MAPVTCVSHADWRSSSRTSLGAVGKLAAAGLRQLTGARWLSGSAAMAMVAAGFAVVVAAFSVEPAGMRSGRRTRRPTNPWKKQEPDKQECAHKSPRAIRHSSPCWIAWRESNWEAQRPAVGGRSRETRTVASHNVRCRGLPWPPRGRTKAPAPVQSINIRRITQLSYPLRKPDADHFWHSRLTASPSHLYRLGNSDEHRQQDDDDSRRGDQANSRTTVRRAIVQRFCRQSRLSL